jgi:uncharacterized protein (TIGR02300 family)
VTKPELGTKRLCAGCNAKFYDLHKNPIVCPTCEAIFVVPKPAPERPRRPLETRALPVSMSGPVLAAPASVNPKGTAAKSDGEKEADAGVPLLEEMDEH